MAALRKAQALAAGASEKEQGTDRGGRHAAIPTIPAAERPTLDMPPSPTPWPRCRTNIRTTSNSPCWRPRRGWTPSPGTIGQPGGKEPKGRTADVQKRLEGVLAKKPDHPWAIHLYIHLVEASDRPERAEPYADRLAALMPGAGHIVHMPSHIYYRDRPLRGFAEVQRGGLEGRRDLHHADRRGRRLSDRLLLAQRPLRAGFGAASRRQPRRCSQQADKLDKWLSNEVATAVPIAQPVKAAPVFRLGAICRSGHDPGAARPAPARRPM